jgi:hypothetical protein
LEIGIANLALPGIGRRRTLGRRDLLDEETCKLFGINPEAYLEDVLVRSSTTPQRQIDTLVPRLWAQPDRS